jgi:ring-1,2-phenylacetyl-CoA epoxidase subunit PaaD
VNVSPACSADPEGEARIARAWSALHSVEDPEIPGISIADLGIIRFVNPLDDGSLEIGLSPTYTGCPATEVIRGLVERALGGAGVGEYRVRVVLAPAWSSDWISAAGRRKLREYGIVPPEPAALQPGRRHRDRPPACPRCNSARTETLSEFGSTPCKALHRCRDCLEPFEYFKCI